MPPSPESWPPQNLAPFHDIREDNQHFQMTVCAVRGHLEKCTVRDTTWDPMPGTCLVETRNLDRCINHQLCNFAKNSEPVESDFIPGQ